MSKPNAFDVFKEMGTRNSQGLMVAPLDQVVRMQRVRAGAHITIGTPEKVMAMLARGDAVGGLIVADREDFERIRRELEQR